MPYNNAMNKNITSKLPHITTPEYVIQPNVISQAIYNLNPYARKLIAMAMSLISPKEGNYTVSFKSADFIRSLGLESRKQSGEMKKYIKAAVQECLDSHIEIDKPNGDWAGYTWFTKSELRDSTDWGWTDIVMTFNPELGEVIQAFKKAFAKISLTDLGKLQSRYAIRFYELALSYSGFAGKDDNQPGAWYFEKTIDEIRILFQTGKKYKQAKEFKRNVIDRPIEEINGADIGIRMEPDYLRRGRRLIGARFNCRYVSRDEPRPVHPATATEKDARALRSKYPEDWERLYQDELRQQPLPFISPEMHRLAAEGRADERLAALHRKPAKN
jgi:plasmid replication initiation protein